MSARTLSAAILALRDARECIAHVQAALRRLDAALVCLVGDSSGDFDVVSEQPSDRRARENAFDVGHGRFIVGSRCVISEGPGSVVDVVQDGECTVELDHDLGCRTVKWHQVRPYRA